MRDDQTALTSLGVEIGHHTDREARTGMTVFVMREGAALGVYIPGGNTGTLNTPAFAPTSICPTAHAVILTGGSTYGLASAFGVMRWLEEQGIGHRTRGALVPGIAGAVIYDLAVGRSDVRPTDADGYRAAQSASDGSLATGTVGVGAGATVGKWYRGTPGAGGFGTGTCRLPHGIVVSAFAVCNALGDVGDDGVGNLPAPDDDLRGLVGSMDHPRLDAVAFDPPTAATTLVVIATNVDMDKVQLSRIARTGAQGLVRGMSPASLMSDGDTVFAMSSLSGEHVVPAGVEGATLMDVVGIGAAEAVRTAVLASTGG